MTADDAPAGAATRRSAGPTLGLTVIVTAGMGALLGIVSAFLVPTGPRLGVHGGTLAGSAPSGSQAAGAAGGLGAGAAGATTVASNGTLLSVGVLLAFLGCLGFGLLARVVARERLLALAPVSAWLIVALLALSQVRGDLVLPRGEPGIPFLYAGVLGGALALLPGGLLDRLRARA